MTNYPPTALETPDCPPHHYQVDSSNVGVCLKCGMVKDFEYVRKRASAMNLNTSSQSQGGKKSLGRPSKRKGKYPMRYSK